MYPWCVPAHACAPTHGVCVREHACCHPSAKPQQRGSSSLLCTQAIEAVWQTCLPVRLCRTQDSQARIEQWLGRVRWASDDHTPVTFEVYSSNPETQTGSAADLHKQLSVLHRVQFADTQTHSARLHLEGWPMTQEVLQALSALPHTFRHLAFTKCKWPLKPSAYRDVAVYVWDSLRSLKLCDVPRDVVKSICKAMARDREGLGLPPLVVQSEHFAQGHFGPHIEVSNGPNAYR